MKLHLIRGLRLTFETLIVVFPVQCNITYFFITLPDKRISGTWIWFKTKVFVLRKFSFISGMTFISCTAAFCQNSINTLWGPLWMKWGKHCNCLTFVLFICCPVWKQKRYSNGGGLSGKIYWWRDVENPYLERLCLLLGSVSILNPCFCGLRLYLWHLSSENVIILE